MDITFRLPGPWGPGKGTNLQAAEVDNNFWEIAEHILDVENNPAPPNGIQSITVSGTQMTITLTDGTVMGPYTLPVLVFRWRGEWQPVTPYVELDVFKVTDVGIFMVRCPHTSGDDLRPRHRIDGGEPALLQLFGSADASPRRPVGCRRCRSSQTTTSLIWNAAAANWVNRRSRHDGLPGRQQRRHYRRQHHRDRRRPTRPTRPPRRMSTP